MIRSWRLQRWLFVAFVVPWVILAARHALAGDPDALWHIVHDHCVPDQRSHHKPAPCAAVDLNAGYAVLKDRVGPLQFLLLPVVRISGIESPTLLAPDAPDWFGRAWRARRFMAARYGRAVPRRDVVVAINSAHARSQNQLHIHVSCIAPAVRQAVDRWAAGIGDSWQPLPAALAGDSYIARRISRAALDRDGAFRVLAAADDTRQQMGRYGLAMTALPGTPQFVMLATHADRLHNHWGAAEELADHACTILGPDAVQRLRSLSPNR